MSVCCVSVRFVTVSTMECASQEGVFSSVARVEREDNAVRPVDGRLVVRCAVRGEFVYEMINITTLVCTACGHTSPIPRTISSSPSLQTPHIRSRSSSPRSFAATNSRRIFNVSSFRSKVGTERPWYFDESHTSIVCQSWAWARCAAAFEGEKRAVGRTCSSRSIIAICERSNLCSPGIELMQGKRGAIDAT